MPLLVALAAAASLHTFNVPRTLGHQRIAEQKQRTGLAVLLPQRIRTEFRKVYPSTQLADDNRYGLVIGAAKFCNGASVCAIANFSAVRGAHLSGGRKVKLARGRRGRFHKSTCGANCSLPAIDWRERGALYRIEYKEATGVKRLKRLANSAIKHGPR